MTGVVATTQMLGDIPWLVLRGERLAVFRALGEHARTEARAVVDHLPELTKLRQRTTSAPGADTLSAVAAASRRQHPDVWEELAALAEGAAVPFDDLLLLNLRGDLGDEDGTGCTDLAYVSRQRAVIAHNEDGAAYLDGRCMLLTLAIDGDPTVTVWWIPGFIPANTFVVTGHGLAWGIDHLTVPRPAQAPGRHFVARAIQREPTLAGVVERLTTTPSAGGFAYTIGRIGHSEATVVEVAAGGAWAGDVGATRPFHWHTNHARQLPDGAVRTCPNSEHRGRFLDGLTVPDQPDTAWFAGVLAGAPLPHGVLRVAEDAGASATLCTFVVDLLERQTTLILRGRPPVTVPAADLMSGRLG